MRSNTLFLNKITNFIDKYETVTNKTNNPKIRPWAKMRLEIKITQRECEL